MQKVYVLFVNHASPYDERPDWQFHSVHATHNGTLKKAASRLSSQLFTPSEDTSYKVIAAQLED